MDNSRMMLQSMDDVDMMLASTNTYVVGRPFDSYNALNGSLLSEFDMNSNHNSVNTSMVLDHPFNDISMLPIIGDDELETPIYIPNRTMSSTLNQQKANEKKSNTANQPTVCPRTNGNPTPVPKFTPAPKKPTKSQLIYEKLKQSMEDEKNKPKREVKSKVSESLKTFSAPKNISREPSSLKPKAVSGSSQVKMRPPTNFSRPNSTVNEPVRKSNAPSSRPTSVVRPNTIPLKTKNENVSNLKANGIASKPQTPSRIHPPTSKSTNSLNQAAANAEKRIQLMEKKLTILKSYAQHNGNGFEAMTALFSYMNKAVQQKVYDLNCAHDELFSTGKANEELKSIINSHIEQSSKSMNEMNKNFDLILKEKTDDYESKLEFLKDQFQHQVEILERQLSEEKERHKIVPVRLKSGEPNVCKGDCNDEIRSLNMTIQLKNDEIHQLRSEARELELKNEVLLSENKHTGALKSQLSRMNVYVKQARENEKLLTKDLTNIQNELMDLKRKNVDLTQRLEIYHYKMGEEGEMLASTHSNSSGHSTGTRSIHENVFPGDRSTPDRPHANSEMMLSGPMVWSSVMRRTKPKISEDEIFDDGGKIEFDESMSSVAESTEGVVVHYESSESSKENNSENEH